MDSDKKLIWKRHSEREVLKTPVFSVTATEHTSPDGRRGDFYTLNTNSWVTVIPVLKTLTPGNPEFILVRQFRYGTGAISVEFPAGVIEDNEPPREAAARELLEETGYTPDSLKIIGDVSPNPAIMGNRTYTVLAEISPQTPKNQNLDPNELLNVETATEDYLRKNMGISPMDSAITIQAWFWYLQKME